ncbi:MAG TPA: sigma-70 family RNA polymerase sigma factor [Fibrobacteria bacterium]|nr:sigma-70 family RNA polymerase sigma factor [Fibrobacteria bacterium]
MPDPLHRPVNDSPDLEEIYRSYVNMVFRICSRYCKDREEAEDLAQESFLRIEKGLAGFRREADLETWIYRICTNCCLAHLRTRQRRKNLQNLYLDSRVIRNLNPDGDRILAKIDLDRILSQFRPLVRHVLFLTLAEGLSYREAGEVLGISASAAAKVVQRFLKKFHGEDRSPASHGVGTAVTPKGKDRDPFRMKPEPETI